MVVAGRQCGDSERSVGAGERSRASKRREWTGVFVKAGPAIRK